MRPATNKRGKSEGIGGGEMNDEIDFDEISSEDAFGVQVGECSICDESYEDCCCGEYLSSDPDLWP